MRKKHTQWVEEKKRGGAPCAKGGKEKKRGAPCAKGEKERKEIKRKVYIST